MLFFSLLIILVLLNLRKDKRVYDHLLDIDSVFKDFSQRFILGLCDILVNRPHHCILK